MIPIAWSDDCQENRHSQDQDGKRQSIECQMVLRDGVSRVDRETGYGILLAQDREKIILLLGGETKRGSRKISNSRSG